MSSSPRIIAVKIFLQSVGSLSSTQGPPIRRTTFSTLGVNADQGISGKFPQLPPFALRAASSAFSALRAAIALANLLCESDIVFSPLQLLLRLTVV